MKYPAVLLAAAAIAFPATAVADGATTCPSKSQGLEILQVTNVKCGKARKVLSNFYEDGVEPKGWTCNQKRNPAGQKTTCKRGDQKIVYSTAD